jgi:hypothetical protein
MELVKENDWTFEKVRRRMIDTTLVYDPTHVYEFACVAIFAIIGVVTLLKIRIDEENKNRVPIRNPIQAHIHTYWHYTPEPYDGGKRIVYEFYQCNIRKFYVEYEWQAREILKILNGARND